MQDAFSVMYVQKALSFEISFKFNFSHCTNPPAHLFSTKILSVSLFCSSKTTKRTTKNSCIAFFFFFPPVTLSARSDILGFFRFPIFCLLFILLPIWGSCGTTNSSEICFLSGLPEHINFSSSFGWTLIILRLYQLPIFWKV